MLRREDDWWWSKSLLGLSQAHVTLVQTSAYARRDIASTPGESRVIAGESRVIAGGSRPIDLVDLVSVYSCCQRRCELVALHNLSYEL